MKLFAITALTLFVSASAFAAQDDSMDETGTESATSASTLSTTSTSTDEEATIDESDDVDSNRVAAPARLRSPSTTSATTTSQSAIEVQPAQTQSSAAAAPAKVVEAEPTVAGDLRAPSPKILDENRRGYFQLGAGPAYGAALKSDSFMYNVVGSYNFNLSDNWTLKGLADLYLASGSVSSRLYNFGVGAEYYLSDVTIFDATPYAAADVGLGFARNAVEDTATGVALGVGSGFKFQARELNFDINAHYEQLTAEVGNQAPALFALRGSVMF